MDTMEVHSDRLTTSQRRRLRRKTLKNIKNPTKTEQYIEKANLPEIEQGCTINKSSLNLNNLSLKGDTLFEKLNNCVQSCKEDRNNIKMDTKSDVDSIQKARDEVKAAREAKKLAKQAKKKGLSDTKTTEVHVDSKVSNKTIENTTEHEKTVGKSSIDEVDRAEIGSMQDTLQLLNLLKSKLKSASPNDQDIGNVPVGENLTVNDVVNTLKDIVNVAKDVENVTAIIQSMNVQKSGNEKVESNINTPVLKEKKPQIEEKPDIKGKDDKKGEGEGKSKAELKAERRAKQEAQRAAKLAQTQEKEQKPINKPKAEPEKPKEVDIKKEKSPKPKTLEKPKKSQTTQKCNWFQHLHTVHDKEALKQVAINSNLHPAVIKLGVQLASRVVTGSNARCIALLDALKKMVRDYILPAKTEFARGLEAQLAASLAFLWKMRAPSASQVNAIKHFRHQLTQLPNNVDEFDAKKKLQEEIDRYIREQIDMAGEAISIAVRNKISNGDNILTYGCSSLIERILRESHEAGVQYRAVIVGNRVSHSAREMLRRLVSAGVACTYVDISALSYVMKSINKVLLGANALLVNGSVLGAVGTLQVALVARAHNVPVLVACETHKFSDRVQTDAFVDNEIGDADALIDKSDENSPLKDWRSNPNLNLLNLTYDVTPASLVTAVVTELAILPCTSAPVILRFKTSEYGM
ncbi:translation initiation factor eIF-2B subunit delta [Pieris napi]|uniref:translation initiation factor eIF-2B subunit delta n=1 Tax=Pieris napi TaxID=78633 RepID=UPI001FB9BA61|nr:translation initiation factor eIF-2B subunit delta [Pieris napi]